MFKESIRPKTTSSRKHHFVPELFALEPRLAPAISPIVQVTGAVSLSVDGVAVESSAGATVQVQKPAGATVRSAYIAAAGTGYDFSSLVTGDVAIGGTSFAWSSVVANSVSSYNGWADVTSLVKSTIDSAPAGRVNFTVTEPNGPSHMDGEALAVIFDDPNVTTTNTIALMFGAQDTSGDTFSLLLGTPVDRSDPNLRVDMSLGISFSAGSSQYSQVDVNGQRMTTSANGYDDGAGANGALITVGGLDDSDANPADPFATPTNDPRSDDELYNLVSLLNNGDQNISVYTLNPSNDDNIFFAAFSMTIPAIVGGGILLSPTTSTLAVGSNANLTAAVQNTSGNPIVGTTVTFVVTSGPDAGQTGTAVTDASGKARFTYSGIAPGTDVVQASFVDSFSNTLRSNSVQVTWTTPSGITIVQTGNSTDVTEGGATDTYTVVLDVKPTGNVTVSISPDAQVKVSATKLVFNTVNWSTAQTVTVTAIDDKIAEGNHTGTITHTVASLDKKYDKIAVASIVARITDNDLPGVIFDPQGPLAILEGTTRTYTAKLNAIPTADVTVNLTPGAGLQLLSPTALVFNRFNWSVKQTVTVLAVDNSTNGNLNTSVSHAISTTDATFSTVTPPSMPVLVVDNDTITVIGGEGPDKISILFSPNFIQVQLNGKPKYYYPPFTQVLILGNGGDDTIQLFNPTVNVAVLGGGGTDKVTVSGQANANTFTLNGTALTANSWDITVGDVEGLTVNGMGKTDTLTVNSVPNFAVSYQAGAGTDSLAAPTGSHIWKMKGKDSGTLDSTLSFSSVENLVGGSGSDTFVMSAPVIIDGQIDGGGGSNTFDFSAFASPVTVDLRTNTVTGIKSFVNITDIVGGTGSDKLIGADGNNTWNITAANGGNVGSLNFRGIENLTGGNQYDTFVFANGQTIKGKIDGGGGTDVLDFASLFSGVTVNLQAKTATNTGGFLNVEQFRGSSATDSLIGADRANIWNVTGADAGDVSGTLFTGFENLTGGRLADLFNISSNVAWVGLLDGGLGADILTGPGASTLNSSAFKGIEVRR